MTIKPIRTEKDYKEALERIDNLLDAKEGTSESDELDILSDLVWAYEEKNYHFPPPDPIEAIKFRMDQLGMKRSELKKFLGYRSRVSEILSGKRSLTVKMMLKLHNELGVSADALLSKTPQKKS